MSVCLSIVLLCMIVFGYKCEVCVSVCVGVCVSVSPCLCAPVVVCVYSMCERVCMCAYVHMSTCPRVRACVHACVRAYEFVRPFSQSTHIGCLPLVLQVCWAAVLWPCLPAHSFPVDCREEQGSSSHCPSISQEKLLDRVIQHIELIYRVSEESCSMFVSNVYFYASTTSFYSIFFFFSLYCAQIKLDKCI